MSSFAPQVRAMFPAALAAVLATAFSVPAVAATLCVNPAGAGCFATIQSAVNNASAGDVINVAPGTYNEGVVIGIPLSLRCAGAQQSTINAAGQPNGVLIDGFTHPGLQNVVISGFTVENALYEGILAVSGIQITISNNNVINNDTVGPVFNPMPTSCLGQPIYETDESGDCGGAIHLIGTSDSTVSGNFITGNADGILISDETGVSQGNLVTKNNVVNNPLECGIVLASHPPVGSFPPAFAPHHGVINNTISNNISKGNGVQVGGSGVGMFSDGAGPGRVSGNLITGNTLVGNGLGGVALHTHVGPAFGLPPDNLDGNIITYNYIASNLADMFDTATPGRVGININSGGGGSPVTGTVIGLNTITDEDIDIAINTPAAVTVYFNNLEEATAGKIGVGNVCAFDSAACTGTVAASFNYWDCPGGPFGGPRCTSIFGANVFSTPSLPVPVPGIPH
jgi:parallel beta-helix repeat protein